MGGSIMGCIWIRLSFPHLTEGTVESDHGAVCSLPSFAVGVGERGWVGSWRPFTHRVIKLLD